MGHNEDVMQSLTVQIRHLNQNMESINQQVFLNTINTTIKLIELGIYSKEETIKIKEMLKQIAPLDVMQKIITKSTKK